MLMNASDLPISGSFILAAAAYVGLSLFVTGPTVGKRTIDQSNWLQRCEAGIKADLQSRAPAPEVELKTDCDTLLGWYSREMSGVCRKHGNPTFNLPFMNVIQEQKRRLRAQQEARLAHVASQAGSRCECAANVLLEERTPFALYAGSARLIEPATVQNLEASLVRSLNSPACNFGGEG